MLSLTFIILGITAAIEPEYITLALLIQRTRDHSSRQKPKEYGLDADREIYKCDIDFFFTSRKYPKLTYEYIYITCPHLVFM